MGEDEGIAFLQKAAAHGNGAAKEQKNPEEPKSSRLGKFIQALKSHLQPR
jgi:hypothetical protein